MEGTTTEAAAEIRSELKRAGISSRQVSVRAEYFSLGSAIRVSVRDGSVSLAAVHAAAERHERIHRCEVTGEILGGGNRYVSVTLTIAAQRLIARRHVGAVEAAMERLETVGPNDLVKVGGTEFLLGHGRWDSSIALWGDSHVAEVTRGVKESEHNLSTAEMLAYEIGVRS